MADKELLTPFGAGIWLATDPMRIVGTRLTATMTILRLRDDQLLLYSPIAMTKERRGAIEALGEVSHLYAPNLFHHLSIGDWLKAFPSARLHAPAGLSKKREDLRIDRVHATGIEPAFESLIDEVRIDGFRLEESVLLYRPARTLVVGDLVHNVGRPQDAWSRFYTQAMGFYDQVALSRMIRWTGFANRRAACKSLNHLLTLPFDSLIVGHGAPIALGGKEALKAAYTWLTDTDQQGVS